MANKRKKVAKKKAVKVPAGAKLVETSVKAIRNALPKGAGFSLSVCQNKTRLDADILSESVVLHEGHEMATIEIVGYLHQRSETCLAEESESADEKYVADAQAMLKEHFPRLQIDARLLS